MLMRPPKLSDVSWTLDFVRLADLTRRLCFVAFHLPMFISNAGQMGIDFRSSLTRLALHRWQPPRDFAGLEGRFTPEDMTFEL